MTLLNFIGTLAGVLTTVAFIPQVSKAWRTGRTEDISLWMFILFSAGVFLWLIYGIVLEAWPIVIANGITLLLSLSILYLKLRSRQSVSVNQLID
jgi:MtN3 and saliva related transmembrane protein